MSPNLTEFSDRLLALCDGRLGLRGGIHVEIHEPSSAVRIPGKDAWNEIPTRRDRVPDSSPSSPATCHSSHILDFISSDETLDRYDEIISASGWRLASYQRNPVFQNAHQYGDIIFTLGKALTTEVRAGKLYQRIEFACDVNPMARIAYGLYKNKFLNAVSVGFVPIRWQNADGTEHNSLRGGAPAGSLSSSGGEGQGEEAVTSTLDFRRQTQDSPKFRRKFLEQELLEVSAVAIPANPNALALGLKSGAIEKSDLRDLADLLRQTLGVKNSLPATKERGESLLEIARELRDLLKQI